MKFYKLSPLLAGIFLIVCINNFVYGMIINQRMPQYHWDSETYDPNYAVPHYIYDYYVPNWYKQIFNRFTLGFFIWLFVPLEIGYFYKRLKEV